jgi:hypothetical protein
MFEGSSSTNMVLLTELSQAFIPPKTAKNRNVLRKCFSHRRIRLVPWITCLLPSPCSNAQLQRF